MKLLAITTRSVTKDYVDLFFLLQRVGLDELLEITSKKYSQLDRNLILKSLVFFEDVVEEPILYKNGNEVSFEVVKKFLTEIVLKNQI
jgi:hypothetical protein